MSQGTYNHEVEMVVLSVGIEPRLDSDVLRRLLRLSRTSDGFFAEAHPKLKPVDTSTAGVFIAGCVESPKDIKDSVTQASAAAARASILMAKGKVTVDKVPCSGAYVSRSSCSRGLTEEQIFPQVDAATERKAERKIIAFCCDLCSCGAVDSAGMNRIQYPASIRVVRTGCLRRVAPEFVKRAFERRAAAVMVACCPVQNGHRTCAFSGMRRELRALRRRMEAFGIDKRRLVSVSVDASEHELFVSKIVEMQKSVDGIKPEDIERSVQLFKQL